MNLATLTNIRCQGGRARVALAMVSLLALLALAWLTAAAGAAVGSRPPATRLVQTSSTVVPIPAQIPHEAGDMVDRRLIPNLRYLAANFPIYITDGYSGPLPGGGWAGCHRCHVAHSDHYNGLAVDIVPLNGSSRCDATWRGVTRLARWAEPTQNHPNPPFRWVGYNGDAGHGCGNHLHLSWNHSPAPEYRLASWVQVFRVPSSGSSGSGSGGHNSTPKRPARSGPSGGLTSSGGPSGGLGAGD
jgi:hypothetical protein